MVLPRVTSDDGRVPCSPCRSPHLFEHPVQHRAVQLGSSYHHGADVARGADVRERIAIEDDQVGHVATLHRTRTTLSAQEARPIDGGGLK